MLDERVTLATANCFTRIVKLGHRGKVSISDPDRALNLADAMKGNFALFNRVAADRAGTLWACNHCQPCAAIDVVRGNPGGDGVVIFVGVAAPASSQGEV